MFICNFIAYILILIYVNYYLSINSSDNELKFIRNKNTPLNRLLFGTLFYLAMSFMLLLIRILLGVVKIHVSSKIILLIVVVFILIIEFIKTKYDGVDDWFKLQILKDNKIIIKFFSIKLEVKLEFLGDNNE